MKTREVKVFQYMDKQTARDILSACHIPLDANFYALSSGEVEELLTYADAHKYRKPKNANGSRGRYFHAFVQRVASK